MPQGYSPLTDKQIAELQTLAEMPDDLIDTSDTPEIPPSAKGEVGKFYRPVMVDVTLRLDNYIIKWFKENAADGTDWDAAINQALMGHIARKRLDGRVPE